MAILALLLVLFFLGTILKYEFKRDDFILEAILIFSLLIFAVSELLSAFNLISFLWIKIVWVLIAITAIGFSYKVLYRNSIVWKTIFPEDFYSYFVLFYSFGFFSITLFIVLSSTPYNWDSMTYHLPRIYYWLQYSNLDHFATTNTRQIFLTPFAEYFALNTYALSGDDLGFNIVQWFYSIGILYVVSSICKHLNYDTQTRFLAILLTATIPMFILQSSSTQNDLVAAFFLLCSFYYVLRFRKSKTQDVFIYLGISVGLAVLSKGTNYIFLLPLAVYVTYLIFIDFKLLYIKRALLVIGIFISINAFYWVRNYNTFENPFGDASFFNETISIKLALSNISKNLTQELILDPTYFNAKIKEIEVINNISNHSLFGLHKILNISPNEKGVNWPGTSWQSSLYYTHQYKSEDYASAPLQITFFVIAILLALLFYRKKYNSIPWILALYVILSFILFSILLKWQPWHNRQLQSLVILASIFSAFFIGKNNILKWVISILIILYAINPILDHRKRSFLKSQVNYFIDKDEVQQIFTAESHARVPFRTIIDYLEYLEIKSIGLDVKYDTWEYPLWKFTSEKKISMNQINVNNDSKKYISEQIPDLIFSNKSSDQIIFYKDIKYEKILDSRYGLLYLKKDHPYNYNLEIKDSIDAKKFLSEFNMALKKYYSDSSTFPKSYGFESQLCSACPVKYNKFWIRNIYPKYFNKIPKSGNLLKYKGNEKGYKLLFVNYVPKDSMLVNFSELIDPVRSDKAFGIWNKEGEKW